MSRRKPKVGRPPRAGKASVARLELRLTADEHRDWTAAAERDGVSVSEWLRRAAARQLAYD